MKETGWRFAILTTMEYARLIVDMFQILLIYNERETIERDRLEIRHSHDEQAMEYSQIDRGHHRNSVDLQLKSDD